MGKRKTLLLIFIFPIIYYACVKENDPAGGNIVINELLPVNTTIVADQDGEYDDWIELYNISSSSADISGYFLSDNEDNFSKWVFPPGTYIPGNGFIVVWVDDDIEQAGLHTNFKLSSLGEEVLLSTPEGRLADKVRFPAQTLELSYSRNPDGTGNFTWQNPTFNSSNNIPK